MRPPPPHITDPVFLERFEVGDWLARGGMADVYRAKDRLGMQADCVVKVANGTRSSQWLRQEAQLLTALRHRHIVRLLARGDTTDGHTILALEFIDGPSYKHVLQRGAWKLDELIRWIGQLCDALTCAHGQGIIHGDLKPANIRIRSADQSLCLLDFGLHAPPVYRTVTAEKNAILGSPRFIAPEHIRAQPVDGRSDVYGLGVLLYRSLTGAYPYQGQTKIETLAAHLFHAIPSFKERATKPILGRNLEDVVRQCLAKDPADRFQTVEQFYAALCASAT